jgi:hypothetical protein
MAGVEPGTDRFKFLSVGAFRARNRIAWGLRDAIAALDAALEDLSSSRKTA